MRAPLDPTGKDPITPTKPPAPKPAELIPTAPFIRVPVGARKVVLVIETPRITDYIAEVIRQALQLGVNSLTKDWALADAEVVISKTKISGAMNFFIRENLPAWCSARTLGTHQILPTGEIQGFVSAHRTWRTGSPFGFIIRGTKGSKTTPAKPERLCANSLTEVISHEVFETLVDPDLQLFKTDPATGFDWLVEVSDHAHAFLYTETIIFEGKVERVILADYTLPSFYDPSGSRPFSKTDSVSAPFHLEENCYAYRKGEKGSFVPLGADLDRD